MRLPAVHLALLLLATSCGVSDPLTGAREKGIAAFRSLMEERAGSLRQRPDRTLTLQECLDQARANSLDLSLARLEEELGRERASLALLEMLPRMPVRLEVGWRDKLPYSRSTYLYGQGGIRDSYATAAEQTSTLVVGELLWSPLDFGLAWCTARQASLEARSAGLLAAMTGRRMEETVIVNYRRLQALMAARPLLEEAAKAGSERCDLLRRLVAQRRLTPAGVLLAEEEEEQLRARLRAGREDRGRAGFALARAMGLDPTVELQVHPPPKVELPALPSLSRAQTLALEKRAELHRADLAGAQADLDLQKAWLKLFPNVHLFQELQYDENKHLLHQSFYRAGARVTVGLIKSLLSGAERDTARAAITLRRQEMLAMSLNVLIQVSLAHLELDLALQQELEAARVAARAEAALREARAGHAAGRVTGVELLRLRMRALARQADRLLLGAEIRAAAARLDTAVGSRTWR